MFEFPLQLKGVVPPPKSRLFLLFGSVCNFSDSKSSKTQYRYDDHNNEKKRNGARLK